MIENGVEIDARSVMVVEVAMLDNKAGATQHRFVRFSVGTNSSRLRSRRRRHGS
jgi:hypothetical protein